MEDVRMKVITVLALSLATMVFGFEASAKPKLDLNDTFSVAFIYDGLKAKKLVAQCSNDFPEINLSDLAEVIEKTEVVTTDRLYDQGKEVLSLYKPSESKVELNGPMWRSLAVRPNYRGGLVLRQYIAIAGVNDDDLEITIRFAGKFADEYFEMSLTKGFLTRS
jgi:hypothetical protein